MCIGIFEYQAHKEKLAERPIISLIARALSVGMILFHADAAIGDALDTPKCLSRFLLEKATGINFELSRR
jgi:hypothetical protein